MNAWLQEIAASVLVLLAAVHVTWRYLLGAALRARLAAWLRASNSRALSRAAERLQSGAASGACGGCSGCGPRRRETGVQVVQPPARRG